ncbi:MAG: flagellar export chaperone FlgN [Hydrogenibacillus sp.]|nr:flagellar export chaperone FlgN [Hydrogenibacillus sp.]
MTEDAALARLVDVLDDLVRVHDALLRVAEAKRAALSAADPAALKAAVDEEETLIRLAYRLEHLRKQHLRAWAEASGEARPPETLGEFLERLPSGPQREALGASATALSRKIAHLRQVNEINQALIRFSLASIDALLRLYAGAWGEDPYGARPGRASEAAESGTSPASFFDGKV